MFPLVPFRKIKDHLELIDCFPCRAVAHLDDDDTCGVAVYALASQVVASHLAGVAVSSWFSNT